MCQVKSFVRLIGHFECVSCNQGSRLCSMEAGSHVAASTLVGKCTSIAYIHDMYEWV